MKIWKRIAALVLSISTMSMSILATACGDKNKDGSNASVITSEFSSVDEGSSSNEESASAEHVHQWNEKTVLTATCTERGLKVKKCACGEEEYEEIPASHDEVRTVESTATCMQGSVTKVTCTKCDYQATETGTPLAHKMVESSRTAPNCTRDGVVHSYCSYYCGHTESKMLTKLGHILDANNYCTRPGCGKYVGNMAGLEPGFWADFAGRIDGDGNVSNDVNYTGDVQINGDPTAAVAYDGSAVTITFYHTMGYTLRGVLDAWIPEFNKMYPNITIEHKPQGSYDDLRKQITTELNGANSPHIAYCYPDHVALYNKSKAVASLDDYIASTATVTKADGTTEVMGLTQAGANEFVRGFYEEGRVFGDGKMYTLPYSKSTDVLYYNKTFFEEHNLQVPTTWDEMETVMQQIVEIDPTAVPLGYDSEANWFISMCAQLDTPYTTGVEGQKFAFDVEANREFMERLRAWYQNGLVTTEEIYGAYTSDLFTQTDPSQIKSYMCIGSSAGASYQCPYPYMDENGEAVYPFEVGVALPPQIDTANPKVISQGPSLCMFKKTNPQEMAATWLFMKFLTTTVGLQANFSAVSGYAPVIKDLDKKNYAFANVLAAADGNANLHATCIKQCLNQENAMFVSPAFIGSSGAREEVGILLQNCFVNAPASGQTVTEFIKEQFEASIDKLKHEYGA